MYRVNLKVVDLGWVGPLSAQMRFLCDGTGKALCCLAHRELARLFHEPHTGLEDRLNMLLSCFRKRMSAYRVFPGQGEAIAFAKSETDRDLDSFFRLVDW